ncbi:hypothetical protein [Paenibacillus amylolyticus]|uniref:DUF4352 domain-containing protein n=1 Tax=Paenibacillus amylolyticus TaxID=1451 RepID=A0ABD8B2N2_PAEAM
MEVKELKRRNIALSIIISLMVVVLSACGKPITEELYSETVSQDVKNSTQLTQEEKDYYSKAIENANSESADLSAKTVSQIITGEKERQLRIAEEEKKRQEEIKRKQEEAEKEKQVQLKLLNESIKVGLIKKSVTYADSDKWIFRDIINMTLDLNNISDKTAKGFQGVISFKDMFGNEIKSLNVKYDKAIKAGSSASYDGSFEVNQFMDEDSELRDTPLEKITVDFQMDQIIFDDGVTVKRSDIE